MTKHTKEGAGPWGKSLSIDYVKLVNRLRERLANDNIQMSKTYDTDFNLFRWIFNAERTSKHKSSNEIIDLAAKSLKTHLVTRKVLKLDEEVPSWDENPLYSRALFPRGKFADKPDKSNRLLWYIEYRSLSLERMLAELCTSQMVIYQFYMYEVMLRQVMQQEQASGLLSSVHHVIDMDGYNMNPVNMLFINNGTMSYFAQLLHYDHYPELVSPSDLVNCSRWMTIPYRVFRGVMPHGFADRFKLHNGKSTDQLLAEIDAENLPDYLGGENKNLRTIESLKELPEGHITNALKRATVSVDDDCFYDADGTEEDEQTDDYSTTLTVHPRRRKIVPIEITDAQTKLSWNFTTDADVLFEVYFRPKTEDTDNKTDLKNLDTSLLTVKYPSLKLSARLVAEKDTIDCVEAGTYYFVFCNRHTFWHKRTVHLTIHSHSRPLKIERERILSL